MQISDYSIYVFNVFDPYIPYINALTSRSVIAR